MTDNHRLTELIALLKDKRVIRSQKEFSELILTDPNIVSGIVKGKRVLSERFVDKVCQVFKGVNKDWLLNGEDPIFKYPIQGRVSIAEEPKYSGCDACKAKDAHIKDLEGQVEKLNGQIGFLQHIIETQYLNRPLDTPEAGHG